MLVDDKLAKEKLIHEIDILGNVYAVAKITIMNLIRNTDLTDCQHPLLTTFIAPQLMAPDQGSVATDMRERCARVCEGQISDYGYLAKHGHFDAMDQAAVNCAAAIRALPDQKD